MLRALAKDYYEKLYHLPANANDIEDFAKTILIKFIKELEDNAQTAVCNGSLESVLFIRTKKDKESLISIKERYLGNEHNKSDPTK